LASARSDNLTEQCRYVIVGFWTVYLSKNDVIFSLIQAPRSQLLEGLFICSVPELLSEGYKRLLGFLHNVEAAITRKFVSGFCARGHIKMACPCEFPAA
jgi:hypothetical protein